MIRPITQDQFKKYFTPAKGPRGSLLSRIQRQCVETRWYQDSETGRIGVIIYDSRDNDWQSVTLENYGRGFTTHEVKTSLGSEKEAVEVLMTLFQCETGETHQLLERMNREIVADTGRTPEEILLAVPES
jgi:hypothetical protein